MYFAEVYVLRDKEDPQNWDVPVWSQKSYPMTAGISEQSGKSIQKFRGSPEEQNRKESVSDCQQHPCLPPRGIRKDLFCPPRGLTLLEARGEGTGEATGSLPMV